MNILKPTAAVAMLAGACAFGGAGAETAEAGGFSLQIGRPAYSGYYGGYNRGYRSFNRGYYGGNHFGHHGYYGGGYGGTSVYHDTSHIDVIGGRPVYHQSGHFDYYGPGHFGGHGGFGGHGHH